MIEMDKLPEHFFRSNQRGCTPDGAQSIVQQEV